jgi:hypothetical protein
MGIGLILFFLALVMLFWNEGVHRISGADPSGSLL